MAAEQVPDPADPVDLRPDWVGPRPRGRIRWAAAGAGRWRDGPAVGAIPAAGGRPGRCGPDHAARAAAAAPDQRAAAREAAAPETARTVRTSGAAARIAGSEGSSALVCSIGF